MNVGDAETQTEITDITEIAEITERIPHRKLRIVSSAPHPPPPPAAAAAAAAVPVLFFQLLHSLPQPWLRP